MNEPRFRSNETLGLVLVVCGVVVAAAAMVRWAGWVSDRRARAHARLPEIDRATAEIVKTGARGKCYCTRLCLKVVRLSTADGDDKPPPRPEGAADMWEPADGLPALRTLLQHTYRGEKGKQALQRYDIRLFAPSLLLYILIVALAFPAGATAPPVPLAQASYGEATTQM